MFPQIEILYSWAQRNFELGESLAFIGFHLVVCTRDLSAQAIPGGVPVWPPELPASSSWTPGPSP